MGKLKVLVYKMREGNLRNMWAADCLYCDDRMQYWAFGATLGAALEHIRRHVADRNVRSLANRPGIGVSSQVRLPDMSGRGQRKDRGPANPGPLLRSTIDGETLWPDQSRSFVERKLGW